MYINIVIKYALFSFIIHPFPMSYADSNSFGFVVRFQMLVDSELVKSKFSVVDSYTILALVEKSFPDSVKFKESSLSSVSVRFQMVIVEVIVFPDLVKFNSFSKISSIVLFIDDKICSKLISVELLITGEEGMTSFSPLFSLSTAASNSSKILR